MSLAERLSRGVKAVFAANLLDLLANAALIVLLTRYLLDPEGYGRLNFALAVLGVIGIVATLGLPKSAARYVTEFAETNPGQVPHVIRRAAVYVGTLGVCVAVGVALFAGPLASLLGGPALVPFFLVGSAYVFGRASTKSLNAIFQGLNAVTWSAVLGVVIGVGRLVFAVGFVLLGFGALGALLGYVAGFLVAGVVGVVVLYTRFYGRYDPAETAAPGLRRRILEYSVPLTATRGANVLDKKVDVVLVGLLRGVTPVGYYTIAKQISDFVSMPAASFGFTISPAIGEQRSGDRADRAARLYERSLEYVLVAYVPATAGLVLVAEPMVRYVFGREYLPAVPAVQVFAGFILVNAINKVTSDGLDYLGRARARAVVKSLTAASNFGLNLLLIPRYGVVGAAAATVFTYTIYTLTNVYTIHTELDLRVGEILRHLAVICLVTVGMVAVVVAALPYVSGLGSLLAVVFVGGAAWAGLSIVGGVLDVREVAEFLA